MGKLTLLFVMVAVLGGSLLTFRTRMNTSETDNERRDVQGDLLARDAATSGHGLVLNAMMGSDGFQPSLGFSEQDVRDGRFTVDTYTAAPGGQTVELSVTGHAGGATHTIRSTYEWDPMDFPGPIWMDVPYAIADVDPGTGIDGGPEGLPVHFDDRRYNELLLHSLLPWGSMESGLNSEFGEAGGAGGDLQTSDMLGSGYLDDLNVADATDLYFAGINAMTMSDVTVTGPHTYASTTQNFGVAPKIVRVTGSLTIDDATVTGVGLLIVEGPLTMTGTSPVLNWEGIVLVHSEDNHLPIEMAGTATVDIDGALVIDHLAVPPGGHMDMTVMRGSSTASWPSAGGINSPIWDPAFPWYQHKHQFDLDVPEERTVYFAEDGADRHEEWSQFRDLLSDFGSTPIYLEFYNEDYHGYADYTLDINGAPMVYTGSVKSGFGAFSAAGDVHRTQAFAANDLESFVVDVQSLRMLRKRWDGTSGCDVWPVCIGENYWRGGALTVRARRASDSARLYEATLYWHMRPDEVADHEAEETALRTLIEGGGLFGTELNLGSGVEIDFDLANIEAIGPLLGFDGDQMINTGTWTTHKSAREYRAEGVDVGVGGGPSAGTPDHVPAGPAPPPPPPPPPGAPMCHGGSTVTVPFPLIGDHLGHGDFMGPCRYDICHDPAGANQNQNIDARDLLTHLGHGDRLGSCS